MSNPNNKRRRVTMRKSILLMVLSLVLLLTFGLVGQTLLPRCRPAMVCRSIWKLPRRSPSSAIAEASKNNWTMAIAITDTGGSLVYFEKMNGTQTGSVAVAIGKSRTAVLFSASTRSIPRRGGEGRRGYSLPGHGGSRCDRGRYSCHC